MQCLCRGMADIDLKMHGQPNILSKLSQLPSSFFLSLSVKNTEGGKEGRKRELVAKQRVNSPGRLKEGK